MRRRVYSLRISILGFIMLILLSLFFVNTVRADPCAILQVSLPDGTYVGLNADPWLNECWLLNLTGESQTFTVRINNPSASKRSYNTRIIIALNEAGYNNLQTLVVYGITVPKSSFTYGTPKPYNLWTWPSGDVYPTWYSTYVNVGYIARKGYKDICVSVSFSDATGVRMHFDAYGSAVSYTPPSSGYITHNPLSADSTVLFQTGLPPLQPPIANFFYYPSYPETYEMVTFNASESYDIDGYIVSYAWDFGDGTPIIVESDPITSHSYTAFGDYIVTLTVTDDDGLTDNATLAVSVRQGPVADFTFSPPDPLEHEAVTFDASASTPDGGVLVSYTWDFGDGNITTVANPIITHTYSIFGNYTITLNVTDSEEKWDTESKPITVERLPIADFWWSPLNPMVCEDVTFDGSTSTPDGGVLISYAWDFGDSTPIVVESDPITTHHYTTNGSFTVTLNVTDSEGRWDTESKVVTVNPRQWYLTANTDPESITTILGEGWYDNCTYVELTAPTYVPNESGVGGQRYKFDYWDVNGTILSGNPISIHMDANHTATAHYVLQYRVTFNQTGVDVDFTGNIVNVDGLDYGVGGLPVVFWWDEGSSHSFSFYSPLVVTPDAKQYVWESTIGLSTLQSDSLTITAAGSVIGNYKTQYYLTVTSPYGTTGGEGWYDSGSTAYSTLNIDLFDHLNGTRRLFTSWSGDASGTDYTQSNPILMDGPKTAIASWKTQYYLTITTTSGGTTNPPSSAWYDDGTLVSVTAIPDTDYVFDRWELDSVDVGSANPYNVTMDTAHTLHAVFVYSPPTPTYYLTVKTDPTGVTTIPGEGWYDENEDVPLTAPNYVAISTDARYKFTHWDINGIPQETGTNSIIVHMDTNHTATAHYILQYYLTVRTSPLGLVTIPGEGWYNESTNVSLTAPSVAGYDFLYWSVDGASQGSGVASISVSMGSPHVAIAYYRQEQAVVGGSTISIKSPLLNTWLSLNIMLAVAIFGIAFWIKRRQKETN